MVSLSEDLIESMAAAIVQEVKPQRVYLFGSCATWDPNVRFGCGFPGGGGRSVRLRSQPLVRVETHTQSAATLPSSEGYPGLQRRGVRQMAILGQPHYRGCRQRRQAPL